MAEDEVIEEAFKDDAPENEDEDCMTSQTSTLLSFTAFSRPTAKRFVWTGLKTTVCASRGACGAKDFSSVSPKRSSETEPLA